MEGIRQVSRNEWTPEEVIDYGGEDVTIFEVTSNRPVGDVIDDLDYIVNYRYQGHAVVREPWGSIFRQAMSGRLREFVSALEDAHRLVRAIPHITVERD